MAVVKVSSELASGQGWDQRSTLTVNGVLLETLERILLTADYGQIVFIS